MHGEIRGDIFSSSDPPNGAWTMKNCIISSEFLPYDQLYKVVLSAHIGLAFYAPTPLNDRLTAFSSEKIALYLQSGVPFVAFNYPGYRALSKKEKCCVLIDDLYELPAAIEKILSSYPEYRRNAFLAFKKHYRFENNFDKVISGIKQM